MLGSSIGERKLLFTTMIFLSILSRSYSTHGSYNDETNTQNISGNQTAEFNQDSDRMSSLESMIQTNDQFQESFYNNIRKPAAHISYSPLVSYQSLGDTQLNMYKATHSQKADQPQEEQLGSILLQAFGNVQSGPKLVQQPVAQSASQQRDLRGSMMVQPVATPREAYRLNMAPNKLGSFGQANKTKLHPEISNFQNQPSKQIKFSTQYRPSLSVRPPIANLTSMLNPGEVLLHKKTNSGQKINESIDIVDNNDIVNLLKQLDPLSLQDHEKPSSSTYIEDDESEEDEPDERVVDSREMEDLKKQNKVKRVLPTSHLFGGAVGLVEESRINGNNASLTDDQLFLNALTDMVSKFGSGSDDTDSRLNDRSPVKSQLEFQQIQRHPVESQMIPIETLVDHLMSSSRLASFGIQHDDVHSAPLATEIEAYEDEDDDEDSDLDNNNTLPPEALTMDINESAPIEVRYSYPKSNLSFHSVSNHTDTWIPMDSLIIGDNLKTKSKQNPSNLKLSKKRARKKRRRVSGIELIIGDKVLNRKDLIRLIRILNKMANKPNPSAERDASRKLLRFLIKLALEEYEKSKNVAKDVNRKDARGDGNPNLLRSIMMGPIPERRENNTHIELRNLVINSESKRYDGTENVKRDKPDEIDTEVMKGKKQGKSLTDLSNDLEQYFDGDFFLDLTDRMNNSSNKINVHSSSPTRVRKRYKLPVPVYEKLQVEEADEEDTDHDYNQLARPSRPPDQNEQEPDRIYRGKSKYRKNKSVGYTKVARKRRQMRRKNKSDDDTEDEVNEDEEPRDQTSIKNKRRQELAQNGRQEDFDDRDDDEPEDHTNQKKSSRNRYTGRVTKTQPNKFSPTVRLEREQRRLKRRRKTAPMKSYSREVDHNTDELIGRDEIPAPILASKPRYNPRLASKSETKSVIKSVGQKIKIKPQKNNSRPETKRSYRKNKNVNSSTREKIQLVSS